MHSQKALSKTSKADRIINILFRFDEIIIPNTKYLPAIGSMFCLNFNRESINL